MYIYFFLLKATFLFNILKQPLTCLGHNSLNNIKSVRFKTASHCFTSKPTQTLDLFSADWTWNFLLSPKYTQNFDWIWSSLHLWIFTAACTIRSTGWKVTVHSLLKCYFPHRSAETWRNANLSPETGPWIWNRKGSCQQILKELLEIIWNYLMQSKYDVSQSERNQIKLKQDPIA